MKFVHPYIVISVHSYDSIYTQGYVTGFCVCVSKYKIAIEQLGIMHILILMRECGTRNTPLHKLYGGYACSGVCYGLLHLNK